MIKKTSAALVQALVHIAIIGGYFTINALVTTPCGAE